MDKNLDRILNLQTQVIRQLTERNLGNVYDDIWGTRNKKEINAVPEKPEGMPSLPDLNDIGISTSKAEEKENKPEQIEKKAEEKPENIEDLKKELDEYIGLESVKDEVKDLINLVTVQNMRKAHGLKVNDMSLHMVFTGNPGTGKTMIARLMARIYKSLNILSKGHLIEVDRSGLVAGFVGQTAIKTSDVIKKAMGGVLFIDEAYALTNKEGNDFGQEAVDTLLKAMEDHREDIIVIVAGYTELMEKFIKSNPGLESRFNRFLDFPDYTVDELYKIFELRCDKSAYRLSEESVPLLKELLNWEKENNKTFGNARGVRNLFEKIVVEQANRLAELKDIDVDTLMLITYEDVYLAGDCEKKGILKYNKEVKDVEDVEK